MAPLFQFLYVVATLMAGNHNPKRRRAEQLSVPHRLLHIGGISKSGLRQVLLTLKDEHDLPLLTSRGSLDKVGMEMFNSVRICADLPRKKGKPSFPWEFADPNKLLSKYLSVSPALQRLYLNAVKKKNPTPQCPWQCIIGFDEFTPGDKFAPLSGRKVMVLSYSFLELGQSALCNDNAWITPAILRSRVIRDIQGGWPHAFKTYLKKMFLGPLGLATAGLAVDLCGEKTILFAKPFVLLSDGDGHRSALDWRGANAIRCCFKHVNVLKKDSNLAHRRPNFVEIDCVDTQRFIRATCDDVKTAMDVLSVAFARVEDGPLGLIADVELRSVLDVAKAIHYDWAQTLLSDGVFTQEVNMLIGSAAAMGKFSIKVVIAFMKDSSWRFPAITAIKDKAFLKIFESHSTGDEAFRLKASSSESVATALRRNPLCCRRFWT